jgi:hypothetical protein
MEDLTKDTKACFNELETKLSATNTKLDAATSRLDDHSTFLDKMS